MNNLKADFINRLQGGLSRAGIDSCSKWAEKYRVMGKPFAGKWKFDHHPWTRAMHDSKADLNIGQKAAQMGYTETVLNWVFYHIDINRESCLYILPTSDDASDFSASRFDPALEMSPALKGLFSNVKNIGLKRAGNATLYVRGSRSKSKLRSVPAGRIVFDELDVMVQDNIKLALERASGQLKKQTWMISTPTVDDRGINHYFLQSTMEHYFFRCPHCSKLIELTFPECLVITDDNPNGSAIKESHLICPKCHQALLHAHKPDLYKSGQWVKSTDSESRGFYINQLYSCTIHPWEIAKLYIESQSDPIAEQELYNSKLGLAHVVQNAKVEDHHLRACMGETRNGTIPTIHRIVTMGIDVGKWLHIEIDDWNFETGEPRAVFIGKVAEFEDLCPLIDKYYVSFTVIDANPERRKALEFCQSNMAEMCFYGRDIKSKEIVPSSELPAVTVDRNSWLSLSLGRIINKQMELPIDTPLEFQQHVKNIVKRYEKDPDGNIVSKWVNGTKDDHHAHSRNYAEIAFHRALANGSSENIKGIF